MQYTRTDTTYILKIEQGEEILKTIADFCEKEGISNGSFSGIGAVKDLSCGYYDLPEKKYYFKQYDGLFEVVSLTGNVMLKEGKPMIHVHGVFTGHDNVAFGGHIEHMTSGIVLEVILKKLDSNIERVLEPEIGLALMQCGE